MRFGRFGEGKEQTRVAFLGCLDFASRGEALGGAFTDRLQQAEPRSVTGRLRLMDQTLFDERSKEIERRYPLRHEAAPRRRRA